LIGSAAPVLAVTNSRFSRNKANDGGALLIFGADVSASVVNSSISKNTAAGFETGVTFGGGIRMDASGGSTLTLVNTVLWGNHADYGADLEAIDAPAAALDVDFDHCILGVLSNTYPTYGALATFNDLGGNLNGVDPGLSRDFHLKAGSVSIDAGTCTGAPTTDFEGDTRPSGAGCDIGADEYTP